MQMLRDFFKMAQKKISTIEGVAKLTQIRAE